MLANPLTMPAMAALLVIVFVLGFVLRRSGKPYSGLMLTVHKLISLVVLILFIVQVYQVHGTTPLATSALAAAVLTVVFFVAAIVTGGLVSIDRPAPPVARAVHWAAPFLTIAGLAATYWQLP